MDRFCPACGHALAEREVDGAARQVCGACGRVHYRNSKPTVAAVVLRDGAVLLARRAREPLRGWWDLPGGFLEAGEEPLEGLRRELGEETGLGVPEAVLLGAWVGTYDGAPTLNLAYLCRVEGEPRAASDVAELRWWPLGALPERMAWPHERAALAVAASLSTQRARAT